MDETNQPLHLSKGQRPVGRTVSTVCRRRWPASRTVLAVLGFLTLMLAACSEPVPVEDNAVELAEPEKLKQRSTEFVVCIDNSRSIKPPEQVLIREATMLLADLADQGDRLSVITFGEAARLVVSTEIQSDEDRRVFKGAVQSQVDFSENYSDIRAGLSLLAERRQELFTEADAVHAAIVFSDGRLEPRDGDTEAAFSEIQQDLEGPLANLELYAVVLGDTYSKRPIDRLDFDGRTLMHQHLASSANHFYHAKQLDQLFEVAVLILKKTKGISSLGEEGGDRFRIDGTVQSMTLIVRKRPGDTVRASDLPIADEIRLAPPEEGASAATADAGAGSESIYRSSDYQHFDLFVVRRPRPGIWQVVLDGGAQPAVLSKIASPINLMVDARDSYYRNEAGALLSWLTNSSTGSVERGDYQLRARIARPGELVSSETYVDLARDAATGQFFLAIPSGLHDVFQQGGVPEVVAIEIVAQNPADPWFLRRTEPIAITFKPPLINWVSPGPVVRSVPGIPAQLLFGGDFDEALYRESGFEVLPTLTVTVEQYNESSGQFTPYYETTEELVVADSAHRFEIPLQDPENGSFRYGYYMRGSSEAGLVGIRSPWSALRVEPNWPLLGAIAVVALLLLQLLGSLIARLRGRLQIEVTGPAPGFTTVSVRPRRVFDSASVREIDLGTAHFRIQAKRYLLFIKRLRFTALAGYTKLNKQPLKPGAKRLLKARGRNEAFITDDEGREIQVKIMLR